MAGGATRVFGKKVKRAWCFLQLLPTKYRLNGSSAGIIPTCQRAAATI